MKEENILQLTRGPQRNGNSATGLEQIWDQAGLFSLDATGTEANLLNHSVSSPQRGRLRVNAASKTFYACTAHRATSPFQDSISTSEIGKVLLSP